MSTGAAAAFEPPHVAARPPGRAAPPPAPAAAWLAAGGVARLHAAALADMRALLAVGAGAGGSGPLLVSESVDFGVVRMEAGPGGEQQQRDGAEEAASDGGSGSGSGGESDSGGGGSDRGGAGRVDATRYRSVRVTKVGSGPVYILHITAVSGPGRGTHLAHHVFAVLNLGSALLPLTA
jgi:hypothetical protein